MTELSPHFYLHIEHIAKEYGVVLAWSNDEMSAFVNLKIIERLHMRDVTAMSYKEWRQFFQRCAHKSIANYWTTTSQQQDIVRQKAQAVTTRCVTRRIEG